MSQSVSNTPTTDSQIIEKNELSQEDILKALDDDSDTYDLTTPLKPKAEKDKPKEEEEDNDENEDKKDEEEIDELAELEKELEEPDEEKLESAAPVPRREILKKYPKLFEEFPALEKSYYRDQQFTKMFATPKDAEEAIESVAVLNRFSEDIIEKGNTQNILGLIKKNNPEVWNNVVDTYLERLAEVDERGYNHVIGNVIKHTVMGMVEEAKESGDPDYKTAAGLLYKFIFGTSKFTPPQKLSKGETNNEGKGKESEIERREKEFNQKQLDTANNEIKGAVDGSIKSAIERLIDPKDAMTPYVKKNAVKDAIDKINNLISKDARITKLVEKLKENMVKENFSSESKSKIRKAYISAAQSLLAPVIKSARNEALKGMGRKVKDEVDDTDTNNKNEKPERQKLNERRLSSDKTKATLDSVKGKNSLDALNEMMGD